MWSVFFSKIVARDPSSLAWASSGDRLAPTPHHLAELAGEDEVLLALHRRDLDGDDVAADLGHDQAVAEPIWSSDSSSPYSYAAARGTRRVVLTSTTVLRLRPSATERATLRIIVRDLALEVPDAGLLGVGANELGHRLSRDLDPLLVEAVVLHCFGMRKRLPISIFSCSM